MQVVKVSKKVLVEKMSDEVDAVMHHSEEDAVFKKVIMEAGFSEEAHKKAHAMWKDLNSLHRQGWRSGVLAAEVFELMLLARGDK